MQKSECRMQNENRLRPQSRTWVWFFVVLAVLGAAAVTLNLVYNLSIQLRPEELAAARPAGRRNGPRNYDLQYQEKITENGVETESSWFVEVRDGKATAVTRDGRELPASDYPNCTVEGQLAVIEQGMQLDQAEAARRTTRRRRSTCATATRRTTSGGCAAAATGWSGT